MLSTYCLVAFNQSGLLNNCSIAVTHINLISSIAVRIDLIKNLFSFMLIVRWQHMEQFEVAVNLQHLKGFWMVDCVYFAQDMQDYGRCAVVVLCKSYSYKGFSPSVKLDSIVSNKCKKAYDARNNHYDGMSDFKSFKHCFHHGCQDPWLNH